MRRKWTCDQRGDCCRVSAVVVMTHQEKAAVEAETSRELTWLSHADPRFISLQAAPCPLLDVNGLCSVYAVRPLNCRRYMCGRQTGDAWTSEHAQPIPLNVLRDRDLRRQYALNERKAQRWGRKMGWPA